jgi:arylsulfatase A-like enzyme
MRSAPRKTFVSAVALVTLTALAGCGPREDRATSPRLVLLYAPCSLSRHYLEPYNPAVRYTPALSAFAREATVFLRHQTEAGQSGPAFASIFSGTQADRHGVYRHPSWLSDEAYLIAEAFAEQGYETHYWNGHLMASADLNYAQGVRPEHVHARLQGRSDPEGLTANDAAFAAILDRLRSDSSYRAFVQVNFTLTHSPYTACPPHAIEAFRRDFPEEWPDLPDNDFARWKRRYRRQWLRMQWDLPALVRERKWTAEDVRGLASTLEALYKANVYRLDRLFGRLVASIRKAGVLDESLIAFTADHGETLYREHSLFKWTHGLQLTPDEIQVPLILRTPGRRGLADYPGVSRSIDVHPTLAGLAGFRVPRGRVDGVDLSAAVRGRVPAPALRAFSHTMPLTPQLVESFQGSLVSRVHPSTDVSLVWTAVRDGDTYVRRRRSEDGRWSTEAFDLARDPAGERDVFDPGSRLHRDLERELEAYKAHLVARHAGHEREQSLREDEVRERLRALGYIR